METVLKHLLEVVEHLAYSHTFRSEAAANQVREQLAEARAALEAAAEPEPEPEPEPETPAPAAQRADELVQAAQEHEAISG